MICYICDRKACGAECPNPDCSYTSDISHAVNFTKPDLGVDVDGYPVSASIDYFKKIPTNVEED